MWHRRVDSTPHSLRNDRHRRRRRTGDAGPSEGAGGAESVRFIEADLFSWRSDRRYDTVFFGFWISHVPEEHFDSFWSLVDDCLRPGGQVFFFDDNYRTEAELIEGPSSPIIQRRTGDGTPFRIVKIPFRADELEARLRGLGWDIAVDCDARAVLLGHGPSLIGLATLVCVSSAGAISADRRPLVRADSAGADSQLVN